jgi:hypothetical protein
VKVGNKAQVVVLSVVAVLAVAFLFFQLKGKGQPGNTPNASATNTPPPNAVATDTDLPQTVYVDPFDSPNLIRQPQEKTSDQGQLASNDPKQSKHLMWPGISLDGDMPPVMVGNLGAKPTNDPVKKVATPVQPEKGPHLVLGGIVSGRTPAVLVAINGGEPQEFSIGQTVIKGITVAAIRDGEIDLKIGAKRLKTLLVGQELQL